MALKPGDGLERWEIAVAKRVVGEFRRRSRILGREGFDDLVQDCVERALQRLDNWRSGESPRRGLFTILHPLFLDQVRRVKRQGIPPVAYTHLTLPTIYPV